MKKLIFFFLSSSLIAMQPAPTPTGDAPMQVEGAQQSTAQPTTKKPFVFHHLPAKTLDQTTLTQYLQQETPRTEDFEKNVFNTVTEDDLELFDRIIANSKEEASDANARNNLELFERIIADKKVSQGIFSRLLSKAITYNKISIVLYLLSRAENIPQGILSEALWKATEQEIHTTVDATIYDIIDALIDAGATNEFSEELKSSPLHRVVIKNDIKEVRQLIEEGADVTRGIAIGKYVNRTPLEIAIRNNNLEIAQELVRHGALVNPLNGSEILHLTALYSSGAMAQFLINNGACINEQDFYERTPLILAAKENNTEVAKVLLDAGADRTIHDEQFVGPFSTACQNGALDVVKLFIDRGEEIKAINSRYKSPLYDAASNGHRNVVEFLIEKGIDVKNATNGNGTTAFYSALDHGFEDIATLLLAHGVNINEPSCDDKDSEDQEYPALYWASRGENSDFWGSRRDTSDIVEFLIQNGADVTIKNNDSEGDTPLHGAARSGDLAIFKLLMQAGADFRSKNNEGLTPLDLARNAEEPNLKLIDLLQKKASRKAFKRGSQPSVEQQTISLRRLTPTSDNPLLGSQSEEESISVEKEEETDDTARIKKTRKLTSEEKL